MRGRRRCDASLLADVALLQLLGLLLVLPLHRRSRLRVRLLLPHVCVIAFLLLSQGYTLLLVSRLQFRLLARGLAFRAAR